MMPVCLRRPMLVAVLTLLTLAPGMAQPLGAQAATLTFAVTSTADTHDATPGDGVCADASGHCTLRAAVEEANAQPAGSTITATVPAGHYVLTLGELDLIGNTILISGAGSNQTIVDGGGASRVVHVLAHSTAGIGLLTLTGGNAGSETGGGLLNEGHVTGAGTVLQGNTASSGGGLASTGTVSLTRSIIRSNTATAAADLGLGGGIDNNGVLALTSSIVVSNTASFGGVYNGPYAYLSVLRSLVSGNTAHFGAGLENDTHGVAVVISDTITANTATVGGGGGIDSDGTLTVFDSTIATNATTGSFGQGGGIASDGDGTTTLASSTVSGNTTSGTRTPGGGIASYGPMTVTDSTISANTASSGGGIYLASGRLTLRRTIVAQNVGLNCSPGGINDGGYNLDSGASCGFSQPTDLSNTDPLLGPLSNNGGPTQTMALLPGSPAIDHGGTSATGCPSVDQRGVTRPDEAADNGACDIGAYEAAP